MKTPKCFLFVGPSGSGKTVQLETLFRSGVISGNVAFLFNDEGKKGAVDARVLAKYATFISFVSGCFGCRDLAAVKKRLADLRNDGTWDWIVVEPMGITSGDEIFNAVQSSGFPLYIIALFSVEGFMDNRAVGLLGSHLRIATIGVGLTNYPEDAHRIDDERFERILAYTTNHAHGKYIFLASERTGLPQEVLDVLKGNNPGTPTFEAADQDCTDENHHQHDGHDHSHHHSHGDHEYNRYTDILKPQISIETIQAILQRHPDRDRIENVKVSTGGRQFRIDHGKLKEKGPDNDIPFITIYAKGEPINETPFAEIVEEPETTSIADAKIILRSGDVVPLEETIQLIKKLMAQMPIEPIMAEDGPVTHPEILELLNEVRKRPHVPEELVNEAIRMRVCYFLAVTQVFTSQSPWWNMPSAGERKRNLAIGIGWFAEKKAEVLGKAMMEAIRRIDLKQMLTEGLVDLKEHNSDDTRAFTISTEIMDTVAFIRACEENFAVCLGSMYPEFGNSILAHLYEQGRTAALIAALNRCRDLATGRPALYSFWQKALQQN